MSEQNLPPEYASNPFIVRLNPLISLEEIQEKITAAPYFDPAERRESHAYRRHCALRLMRAFFPLKGQVIAIEKLIMMICDGYIGRDPGAGLHHRCILDAVERIEHGDLERGASHDVPNRAGSAAIIGIPGMGKTTTISMGMKILPAVLRPDVGYTMTQIPIIELQCPAEGSVKQFCKNFFKRVDKRLGQNRYFKQFGKDSIPAETMLLHVQHIAQLHAIGVIVIDEIQNLLTASGKNAGALMKFYVTMTNTIGVPVLLIGTMSAAEILQHGFHAARRADGFGSEVWDRAAYGEEWRDWLEQVWQFQWTNQRTKLTDELAEAMYQQTQGVLDLAIKLHMLVQMRVMHLGQFSDRPETITKEIIDQVASESFNMVRPMIMAIRDGNLDALDQFRDISGFQASIDKALASMAGLTTAEYHRRRLMEHAAQEASVINDPYHLFRSSLRAQGFKDKEADRILMQAEVAVPSGDHLLISQEILRLVAEANAERAKPRKPSPSKNKRQPVTDPQDVRSRSKSNSPSEPLEQAA
jgi:hypothetical protein